MKGSRFRELSRLRRRPVSGLGTQTYQGVFLSLSLARSIALRVALLARVVPLYIRDRKGSEGVVTEDFVLRAYDGSADRERVVQRRLDRIQSHLGVEGTEAPDPEAERRAVIVDLFELGFVDEVEVIVEEEEAVDCPSRQDVLW